MKRRTTVSILVLLLFTGTLYAQQRVVFPDDITYDPFYAARITDSDDNEYLVSNMRYLSLENGIESNKSVIFIRRGTKLGVATYPLSLSKIKSIEFNGSLSERLINYIPAEITLVNDIKFQGFVYSNGYLAGMDNVIGSYVKLYMNYNFLKKIVFIQDGTYKYCPKCGAIYYDSRANRCPFDKTKLKKQLDE